MNGRGWFFGSENLFKVILAPIGKHGKSPCFLEVAFLRLLGVDCRALKVTCLHGAKTWSVHFDIENAKKAVQNSKRVLFILPISGLVPLIPLEPTCDFVI